MRRHSKKQNKCILERKLLQIYETKTSRFCPPDILDKCPILFGSNRFFSSKIAQRENSAGVNLKVKVNDETLFSTGALGDEHACNGYRTDFILPFQHLKTCKSKALAPNQVFM